MVCSVYAQGHGCFGFTANGSARQADMQGEGWFLSFLAVVLRDSAAWRDTLETEDMNWIN